MDLVSCDSGYGAACRSGDVGGITVVRRAASPGERRRSVLTFGIQESACASSERREDRLVVRNGPFARCRTTACRVASSVPANHSSPHSCPDCDRRDQITVVATEPRLRGDLGHGEARSCQHVIDADEGWHNGTVRPRHVGRLPARLGSSARAHRRDAWWICSWEGPLARSRRQVRAPVPPRQEAGDRVGHPCL